MSAAQPTSTPTFFLCPSPNGKDPCINMENFLNDKKMHEMRNDFFPLDRKNIMKHSKIFHIPYDSSQIKLNISRFFLLNHVRSKCLYDKTRNSCDGVVDRTGRSHTKHCSYNLCCRGLIVDSYINFKRLTLSGINYIELKLDFDFEDFSETNSDFKRTIEKYYSICKILFVKIHPNIVDNSLAIILSYSFGQSPDFRSSAEPKIGETRIFVQYDILLPDGTSEECLLDVLILKHDDSFPDIYDVEYIYPSLE